MDIYHPDFVPEQIVLLSNNGDGNKGIPIRCDHYILVLCTNGQSHRRVNHHQEVVIAHIVHLLFLIKRRLSHSVLTSEKSSRINEIFITFKSLIEQYFQYKKAVMEYAELMHISAKHLSETVKSITNHTALHFIHERIIHEAEYLLVYSHLNVKEISNALNFENPSHFGKFFKKHRKMTPLEFRAFHK